MKLRDVNQYPSINTAKLNQLIDHIANTNDESKCEGDFPITTPYIIGIAGSSCSGKTLFTKSIKQMVKKLSPHVQITVLSEDNYCLPGDDDTNYDVPTQKDLPLLWDHLTELTNGNPIESPIYDFIAHKRSDATKTIHPSPIIIVEGLFIFHNESFRKNFHLKIFIETDGATRYSRRLKRDMNTRCKSISDIRKRFYRDVLTADSEYIKPSSRFADIIVPNDTNDFSGLEFVLNLVKMISILVANK